MTDNPATTAFKPLSTLKGADTIVAVTGGTGFIGERLVRRLVSDGYSVRVLTRQPSRHTVTSVGVELFQGDLAGDPHVLAKFLDKVDILYHCAAEINLNEKMIVANVEGTRNLARAAQGNIRHWVQLSTVDVYGTHTDGIITEETPIAPVNIYEASKAESDAAVIEAAGKYCFTYSILRPSKVYGLGMRNQVLFQLFRLVDRGLFFYIGKSGASANYIHVNDVVEGLIRCGDISAAKNRVYNLSDYRPLEEFVAIISDALQKPHSYWRIPEVLARVAARITAFIPGNPLTEQRVNAMVKRARYSTLRIETELNYRVGVPMETGLHQLVSNWSKINH